MSETNEPKILVLFYSIYGHILQMAKSVRKGIKDAGGNAKFMMVEELTPEKYLNEKAKEIKKKTKDIPIADPRKDLKGIDGIIIGTPTRYGNMCAQMRNFWDQTGADWAKGTLVGKPAGVFTGTGTQHGGQETTIITVMITLLHHGLVLVGTPYTNTELMEIKQVQGGTPYGPSTIAGPKGNKYPNENELKLAFNLGKRVTTIAQKLKQT
ncbi:MAG: NAD(P)H:quinone oxidoreductase [Candidatus Lokiarchaeota archaeon]|nr:NAD(P)H:quinone oxidoreductase [Candidatus Lokiarchaeota archaeon]